MSVQYIAAFSIGPAGGGGNTGLTGACAGVLATDAIHAKAGGTFRATVTGSTIVGEVGADIAGGVTVSCFLPVTITVVHARVQALGRATSVQFTILSGRDHATAPLTNRNISRVAAYTNSSAAYRVVGIRLAASGAIAKAILPTGVNGLGRAIVARVVTR